GLLDEGVRAVDVGQRLLQVDDVDAVALGHDEALHLRVPATGLVTEVDAALEELAHGDDCHDVVLLWWRSRPLAPTLGAGRTGGCSGCFQLPQTTGAGCPDAHARPHPDLSGTEAVAAHGWSGPGSGPVAVSERAKSIRKDCCAHDSRPPHRPANRRGPGP